MVKAYLRYELSNTFGVINSNANLVYDHTGKLVISAALENINVWNARQGTLVRAANIERFYAAVFTQSAYSYLVDASLPD